MYQPACVSVADQPWRANTDANFEAAARECEIHLSITAEHHDQLCQHLKFDRRARGLAGCVMQDNYAPLGLQRGDRLEPSAELPDIGAFFTTDEFPLDCVFLANLSCHTCVAPLFFVG